MNVLLSNERKSNDSLHAALEHPSQLRVRFSFPLLHSFSLRASPDGIDRFPWIVKQSTEY